MHLRTLVFTLLVLGYCSGQERDDWTVFPHQTMVDLPNSVPTAPVLIKSLGDAAEMVLRWKPPTSAAAWTKRRVEVDRALRQSLGLTQLPQRTPLNARILRRHEFDGFSIENMVFESRPGFVVTANLYRPLGQAGKRPAVLSPIGHFLRQGKAATDVQARCIHLARMGFVVLVYDAIGQGERMVRGNVHHEAGYALLPLGETIAGWMVWDSMRAIDYLQSLPDVDGSRIGLTGNSGGGLNTLLTAAMDQRIKAAVVVGYTFEFNNWLKYGGIHCTCTHWPGIFASMEWFEVAGLIAPRALMLMQGDQDGIFPISGARRAARDTAIIYGLLGQNRRFRFDEIAGQPHAYSLPYREHMYGFLKQQLLFSGNGTPVAESGPASLSEDDGRLLCGQTVTGMTVVDYARRKAVEMKRHLPSADARQWVLNLTATPEDRPHYLSPRTGPKQTVPDGYLQKFSFLSEDGENLPGLLWTPEKPGTPAKTVLIVDARGKSSVAKSGLIQPLLQAGLTVVSVDLRGRGETLLEYRPGLNTNFRLIANQVLMGQPLVGRRAFDLIRTLDYLGAAGNAVSVVGIGDDALPAILATVADRRIQALAVTGFSRGFADNMRTMRPLEPADLRNNWNSAQVDGLIHTEDAPVDLGSVLPGALLHADIPDLLLQIAPRKVLQCTPGQSLTPQLILTWLEQN